MQDQTTLSDLERDVRGPPEYDLTLSKSTESTGYSSKDQDDAWEPESSASKDKGWQKPKSTAWQKEKSTGWQPYQAHAYTPAKAIDKVRPSIPYAQLIAEAIESTPEGKITLNGIYNHVTTNYPYFQNAGAGWKNSVRHNLSLNKNFVRVPRPITEKGKGAYWTFQDDSKPETAKPPSRKPKPVIETSIQTPQYYHSPRPNPAHYQMLYQAPNPEIYEGLFHDTQTSHDTFTDHDDFTRSKTNYLDQFERMLAMEQSRQSSQTSIETFHTYDDSIPESNIFYEQVGYGFEQHYQQGYDPETVWFTEASFTDRV